MTSKDVLDFVALDGNEYDKQALLGLFDGIEQYDPEFAAEMWEIVIARHGRKKMPAIDCDAPDAWI